MKTFVATVQIAFEAESMPDACDYVSGLLETTNPHFGWQYLKVGEHYLYPTEHEHIIDAGQFGQPEKETKWDR